MHVTGNNSIATNHCIYSTIWVCVYRVDEILHKTIMDEKIIHETMLVIKVIVPCTDGISVVQSQG